MYFIYVILVCTLDDNEMYILNYNEMYALNSMKYVYHMR